MPDLRSGRPAAVLVATAVGCASGVPYARAQLPALPTAESAFPAPGLAVALDAGHADGRTVGALAVATGVRRLQLTAAIGVPGAIVGYNRSGVSAGGRIAGRLYRSPRLGVSAFAGFGVERMRAQPLSLPVVTTPTTPTTSMAATTERPTGAFTQIPVGISAGVRGILGERPYAISVAPMYAYSRWRISEGSQSHSGARIAALAELAVTPQIGIGFAGEIGSGGPAGSPYAAHRTVIGAGVSYAIHRFVAR